MEKQNNFLYFLFYFSCNRSKLLIIAQLCNGHWCKLAHHGLALLLIHNDVAGEEEADFFFSEETLVSKRWVVPKGCLSDGIHWIGTCSENNVLVKIDIELLL